MDLFVCCSSFPIYSWKLYCVHSQLYKRLSKQALRYAIEMSGKKWYAIANKYSLPVPSNKHKSSLLGRHKAKRAPSNTDTLLLLWDHQWNWPVRFLRCCGFATWGKDHTWEGFAFRAFCQSKESERLFQNAVKVGYLPREWKSCFIISSTISSSLCSLFDKARIPQHYDWSAAMALLDRYLQGSTLYLILWCYVYSCTFRLWLLIMDINWL